MDTASPSDLSSDTDMVQDYVENLTLHRAIDKGDWETAKNFLARNPGALTANLSWDGDRALHIAVVAGNVDIVAELVKRLAARDLELQNQKGATALHYAAEVGITAIAEHIIRKNPKLITIPSEYNRIPVVIASALGHKDMVRYLYDTTPKGELSPERGNSGAELLTYCILGEQYDIALDLVRLYPSLALSQGGLPLRALTGKPSAFPSGSTLAFWKRWTYSLICIPSPQFLCHDDIESIHNRPSREEHDWIRRVAGMFLRHLKYFVPTIKYIYDLKMRHTQAKELLCRICEIIATKPVKELCEIGVTGAVSNAVKHGIVEFVEEIIKQLPHILWLRDDHGGGMFHNATAFRQEKIFGLIYRLGGKKSPLAAVSDNDGNTILHLAALIAPSSQLDRSTGPALQMQRELQWFKEVEHVVPPVYKERPNNNSESPRKLFTEQHKKLKEEGEKWMKKTAECSIVVAALIVTIMFAAALAVPGGYDDDTGVPRYLNRKSFMVFIISDALSLIFSSTSLLMFLGILTSQYKEEDFLKSLPTKLLVGLSALFFSIPTMMINFGITLSMTLHDRGSWVSLPIILLGSIPATIFALQQFPLLLEVSQSTYGPGIFDKPKQRWFLPRNLLKNKSK